MLPSFNQVLPPHITGPKLPSSGWHVPHLPVHSAITHRQQGRLPLEEDRFVHLHTRREHRHENANTCLHTYICTLSFHCFWFLVQWVSLCPSSIKGSEYPLIISWGYNDLLITSLRLIMTPPPFPLQGSTEFHKRWEMPETVIYLNLIWITLKNTRWEHSQHLFARFYPTSKTFYLLIAAICCYLKGATFVPMLKQ